MEIIYHLPLPDDICSKIFIYARHSPLDDLGIGHIRKWNDISYSPKKTKRDKELKEINLSTYRIKNMYTFQNVLYLFTNLKKLNLNFTFSKIHISSFANLKNIEILLLCKTNIYGNLYYFHSFNNLKILQITDSRIYGHIRYFTKLNKILQISAAGTNIYGDISTLNPLKYLTRFCLSSTNIYGSLNSLQNMKQLTNISIYNMKPMIYCDYNQFNNYREEQKYKKCFIEL
jgi:hypothetical protein